MPKNLPQTLVQLGHDLRTCLFKSGRSAAARLPAHQRVHSILIMKKMEKNEKKKRKKDHTTTVEWQALFRALGCYPYLVPYGHLSNVAAQSWPMWMYKGAPLLHLHSSLIIDLRDLSFYITKQQLKSPPPPQTPPRSRVLTCPTACPSLASYDSRGSLYPPLHFPLPPSQV